MYARCYQIESWVGNEYLLWGVMETGHLPTGNLPTTHLSPAICKGGAGDWSGHGEWQVWILIDSERRKKKKSCHNNNKRNFKKPALLQQTQIEYEVPQTGQILA